jgi:hypothetical protein
VEICAFSVVYNDCWWISSSVQLIIMHDGGLCACSVIYAGFLWTAIPPTITINSQRLPQFHRQSLKTTEHYCNSTENHYTLMNTLTIPPTIIISYRTRTQFHEKISINGGIVIAFSSLLWFSVGLRQCSVVYDNCGWNCVRVQQFIMIDCKIAVVFSSADNHIKLLNTTAIPPTITINYWTLLQCYRQSL